MLKREVIAVITSIQKFKCLSKTMNKQARTGKDVIENEVQTVRQGERG
jgi:hypothetical protein